MSTMALAWPLVPAVQVKIAQQDFASYTVGKARDIRPLW